MSTDLVHHRGSTELTDLVHKHFIWTRFKMGFHGHWVHVLSVLTREVSAYTRQAFKLGDDNQEWLLTYISVLHKVY